MVEDVHEVDVGVVGGFVGREIIVDGAVGEVLGAHVIGVVAGGETTPIAEQYGIVLGLHDTLELEQLLQGVGLHGVAEPGGEVAGLIGPADGVGDVELAGEAEMVGTFGGRSEIGVRGEGFGGEVGEEVEDAGVGSVMLAEGFEVHEEVADLAADAGAHAGEFFGGEGMLGIVDVAEVEGEGVAEDVVAEEDADVVERRLEDERGGAVGEGGGPAFGEDDIIFEAGGEVGDVVGVDELGIAEGARRDAEETLKHLAVEVDLFFEFLVGIDAREGVVVGFAEELDAAGGGEGVQEVHDLGGVLFELFNGGAGDGDGEFEAAGVGADVVEQAGECGDVTAGGDFLDDLGVEGVVEVLRGGVEDAVTPKANGLMDLKIKADGGHNEGDYKRRSNFVHRAPCLDGNALI